LAIRPAGTLALKNVEVLSDSSTRHLSSCNFALRASSLRSLKLFFDESFPYPGCEDVELSERIVSHGEKIYFFKDVFVYHAPIMRFGAFLRMHFRRGRAIPISAQEK